MTAKHLDLVSTVSNSEQLSKVPSFERLERHVGLLIKELPGDPQPWIVALGRLFPLPECLHGRMRPLRELFGSIQSCRRVWQEQVVDRKTTRPYRGGGVVNVLLFQEVWDQPVSDQDLRQIGAELAIAGDKLFHQVFETGDESVRRIGQRLCDLSAQQQLTMTITSDECSVPWGMIYTHPGPTSLRSDGSNFSWQGFWGLQHVIEHNFADVPLDVRITPDESGRVTVGIYIDDRIDDRLGIPCIRPQLEFFHSHADLQIQVRLRKSELREALESPYLADRILYFCCHGVAAGDDIDPNLGQSRITLSDDDPIGADDIEYWLDRGGRAKNPIVFINACEAGQMTTIFYKALAAEFLRHHALGVIGAQVGVPAVFAAEYAQRFFRRLLDREKPARVGPLMTELAREFLKDHRNPLGIVYSLYRGLDCFVHRGA